MKSAFLLSHDPQLTDRVTRVLVERGAAIAGDTVQLTEGGEDRGMFTFYGRVKPHLEFEFRDPPWECANGVALPDMATVDGYYVECRWEVQFAEIAKELAEASDQPLWVMDSNGVVWDAVAVDPDRILL